MNNAAGKKPEFRRADHVSLTVNDIEAAIEFYQRVFGAEVEYRMGPFDAKEMPVTENGRDWTDAYINVPGARLQIAMLKMTENLNMELFQYDRPEDAVKKPPRNCDAGSRHLCLEVDDVERAVEYLKGHGCQAMSGPIEMRDGPCPPSKSWYILDPFDNQLELVEYL